MPKPKRYTRDLHFRVDERLKTLIDQQATLNNVDPATYVRNCILSFAAIQMSGELAKLPPITTLLEKMYKERGWKVGGRLWKEAGLP